MVGQGIFTTPGYLGHDLRSPWLVLLVWALGGLLALAGALLYAELGTLVPRAGGEYAYIHAAYGRLAGFLTGWATFLGGFSAPCALSALAFIEYGAVFFPEFGAAGRGGSPSTGDWVAAGLILAITSFHYAGVGSGVRLQNALTFLKAAVVLALIAGALLSGAGDPSRIVEKGDPPPIGDLLPLAGTGLLFVFFSYSGWNAATYLAGEVREPARALPRAALLGTLSVTAVYLALNMSYLAAIPAADMEAAPNVARLAAGRYFGGAGARVISAVIMATQLGTISALVLAGSRVCYAMGEDGVAWRGLARLSGDHTPRRAVALQGFAAALMALATDFQPLMLYSGAILILFSALAVSSLLVLRRRIRGPAGAYRAPLGALLPAAYIAGAAVILVFAGIVLATRIEEDGARWALIAAASIPAGLPIYWLSARGSRGRGRAPPADAPGPRSP
jgi:APA family basic amino acid/polyamine antiporter